MAPVVEAALAEAGPYLAALERIIVDHIVPAVGADLAGIAGLRFLEGIGNALWMSGELAGILASDPQD